VQVDDPDRTILVRARSILPGPTYFLATLFGIGPKLSCPQIEVPPRGADRRTLPALKSSTYSSPRLILTEIAGHAYSRLTQSGDG
jgi:hypothetical protein